MPGAAEVTYTNLGTEVVLDYDSKNQKFDTDAVTVPDSPALAYTLNIINTVYASDLRWSYYTGLLNGAPMNSHMILHDGSSDPPSEDVTITVN